MSPPKGTRLSLEDRRAHCVSLLKSSTHSKKAPVKSKKASTAPGKINHKESSKNPKRQPQTSFRLSFIPQPARISQALPRYDLLETPNSSISPSIFQPSQSNRAPSTSNVSKTHTRAWSAPKLKGGLPSNNPTRKRNSFRDLPPEIREMIWNPLLDWNGKVPKLIKALRQDRELHAEAMELFYKKNHTYVLNQRNYWSFIWMSDKAILSIRKLKIEIKEFRKATRTKAAIQIPQISQITRLTSKTKNLQEVVLASYLGGVRHEILRQWDGYLLGFGNSLRKVTIDFRFEPTYNAAAQNMLDRELVRTVKNANELFGIEVRRVIDSTRRGKKGRSNLRQNNIFAVILCWEVTEGKFMEIVDKKKRSIG